MIREVDVAVLGGGPSGLAAAIVLAKRGRSVVVFDRSRSEGPRVGETLLPDVRHMLSSIGADEGFDAIPAIPFVGTKSVWGAAEPFERSAILNPLGAGLHVDRAAFDTWFARQAVTAGVCLHPLASGLETEADEKGWKLRAGEEEFSCRFLIDARGRSSPGDALPRRWIAFDRLVGIVAWMHSDGQQAEPELLIEAVEQGWWYSAPQPEGGLVATLMTDADLITGSGTAGLEEHWRSALDTAPLTKARLESFTLARDLEVRRADSGFSYPDRGLGWRAIGDAALAWDPLAGTGIARAIKSGIDAAQEIDDLLSNPAAKQNEPAPPPLEYLEQRAKYYRMETRWPSSPFWMRRQPVDLTNLSVFIDPESMLVATDKGGSIATLAPIEALLPPRAIRDFLAQLQSPVVAHAALTALRELCGNIGDQRILAGVQMLVMAGIVESHDSLG